MRTLQRFATVCFLGAAAAALITACSSTDAAPPPGAAGAAQAGAAAAGAAGAHAGAGNTAGAGGSSAGGSSAGAPTTLTGDPTRGQVAYNKAITGCPGCHSTMGQGMLGPNITGSTTAGIGGKYTEPQFHEAVRNAKNRMGTPLYFVMQPVTVANLSDQEIADIYAWLMSMKVDTVEPGSYCSTGMCTGNK